MWLLIAFVSAGIDLSKYKLDTVCYGPYNCGEYAAMYEEDYWDAVGPGAWSSVKDNIGKFVYAGEPNLEKCLGETKNYLVQVLITDSMRDNYMDVDELDGPTVLHFDSIASSSKVLNQTDKLAQAEQFLKKLNGVAHLREIAAKQGRVNKSLIREVFIPTGKEKATNTLPVVKKNDSKAKSLAEPVVRGLGLKGDHAHEKIDYLMIENCSVDFQSSFHVPALYLGNFAKVVSQEYLQADYLLTWVDYSNYVDSDTYGHYGVITKRLSSIELYSNRIVLRGIEYGDSYSSASFSGGISVLVVPTYYQFTVTLEVKSYGSVPNLNLSLQKEVMTNFEYGLSSSSGSTMTLEFPTDWDNRVSTSPEFILETDNVSTIEIVNQPTNVNIKRTSVSSRVVGGGRSNVNIGLIIGIVVAVIVVIIIIVVIIVVVVVCSKKKSQVEADTEDNRNAQSSQPGSQPYPQSQAPYGQQYPQYQYPQQYPSSQYAQQYPQYQQPPPQYQQPPPQYQQPPPQYQQPPPHK